MGRTVQDVRGELAGLLCTFAATVCVEWWADDDVRPCEFERGVLPRCECEDGGQLFGDGPQ